MLCSISGHAETLEPDIAEAMRKYGATGEWTARSLGLEIQAVLQGSFILAKAKGGPAVAAEHVDHQRRYIKVLAPMILSSNRRQLRLLLHDCRRNPTFKNSYEAVSSSSTVEVSDEDLA